MDDKTAAKLLGACDGAMKDDAKGSSRLRRRWLSQRPREARLDGADAVAQRKAEMRDAGLEVVGEALDHRRQLAAVDLHEVLAEQRRQGWRAAS